METVCLSLFLSSLRLDMAHIKETRGSQEVSDGPCLQQSVSSCTSERASLSSGACKMGMSLQSNAIFSTSSNGYVVLSYDVGSML